MGANTTTTITTTTTTTTIFILAIHNKNYSILMEFLCREKSSMV
jgi:hypothetical protein